MKLPPAPPPLPEVPESDWARTPDSVRALVEAMAKVIAWQAARIDQLEARMLELEERLGLDSSNSSKPPSSDPPTKPPAGKPRTGRKPGGQPGHKGHRRTLIPTEQCDHVVACKPTRCGHCQHTLSGSDPQFDRHQVTELPKVVPTVIEYQLHTLACGKCGEPTRGALPEGVSWSAFGPRAQATAALLAGVYRLSHRSVCEAMRDLFGVTMSLGSVSACERVTAQALEQPVAEARAYAQSAPVAHADETGWREGRKRAWLWVMSTALVTVFLVHKRRGTEAAKALLGKFAGQLVTDRWCAYNRWGLWMRQLCWAHLKRDAVKISERGGESGRIGEALCAEIRTMFHQWHRMRGGEIRRGTFVRTMRPLRARVESLLREGSECSHPRTAGMCKEILKLRPALWTFVETEGVEPTNNQAEREIRRGVLWRKTSFGTHSKAGSRFVERMLTAFATLRQQGRNVVEFVVQAVTHRLRNWKLPSLLPHASEIESGAQAA